MLIEYRKIADIAMLYGRNIKKGFILQKIASRIQAIWPKIETVTMGSILTGIVLFMLSVSWRKWPDILVDFGRELYVPWQLTEGKVLYLDIAHYYGPLSQYFNAALFELFGTGLMTLVWFNIGLVIALIALIYYFFSFTTDKYVAFVTSSTFLLMFAFSQYVGTGNYNFICPYSHELTHGVFLAFVDLVIFVQFLRKRRIEYSAILGIITGIIFLTKLEIFLAVAVALSVGFVCLVVTEKVKISRIFKLLGLFTAGFMAPIICFLIYFSTRMNLKEALIAILQPYALVFNKTVSSNIFALRNLGFDAPFFNISRIGIVTLAYVVILTIMCLLTFLVARVQNKSFRIIIGGLMLIVFPLPLITFHVPWPEIFRPLPLVMLALTVYFLIQIFRTRHDRQEVIYPLSLLVMTVFASLMLLKIFLNVHVYHYGFSLAMPAVLLLVMAMLYQLPRSLGQFLGSAAFFRGLGMVLLLVILIVHVQWSKKIYDLKTYPVGHGSDTIISWNPAILPQGVAIDLALKQIQKFVPEGQNFVVFPEGIILNYLSRRQSASPNIEFMPSFLAMVGEEKIIRDFDAHKADFIILVHRDTLEFGARYFGVDYAVKFASWIEKNYSPVARIGDVPFRNNNFGIILAKRSSLQQTN